MTAIPNSLSLTTIADGSPRVAAPVRNNYSAIQAGFNALVALLSGGTAGQVFTAIDATDAGWASPAAAGGGASLISSLTSVASFGGGNHAGLAQAFTPSGTGRVAGQIFMGSGSDAGGGGSTWTLQLRYGTGTAPVKNAAAAGTALGPSITSLSPGGRTIPFVVSGLTPATAYWFDLVGSSTGGSTAISLGSVFWAMTEC